MSLCTVLFYAAEDIVMHEFASLCLVHMSIEYNSKVQIFEQGGLEPLIRLLSSPDPDVKKNCVECIYNMVQVMSFLFLTEKYLLSCTRIFNTVIQSLFCCCCFVVSSPRKHPIPTAIT